MKPNLSWSQNFIEVSKEMPIELSLMVNAIQKNDPNAYAKIIEDIKSIDKSARLMTKEDILLIAKTEIYKSLLRSTGPVIKSPVNGTSLDLIQKSIQKATDPFLKWFLLALLKDTKSLINTPTYSEFLLQKNNDLKVDKIEHKKLEKKGELLQQWITKLNPNSEDYPMIITQELNKKIYECLKNIASSFQMLFIQLDPSLAAAEDSSTLKYFTLSQKAVAPTANKQNTPAAEKTVEEILAPVTNDAPLDLPKPSSEEWIEQIPSSNLPKPSNDADWLQDF